MVGHARRGGAVIALPLMVLGCALNPETGKQQLIVIDERQEIALGEQAAPRFLEELGGAVPSAAIQAYVTQIGMGLARSSTRSLLPWSFHLVDSSVVNAFALPGGKVFISRGLVELFDNEAQLAGVLGHEIGHVCAKHINDQMAGKVFQQTLLTGVDVASRQANSEMLRILGVGTEMGTTMFLLHYSREQEHEADDLGIRYMARRGYNPIAQVQVMSVLMAQSSEQRGSMALLSTHPLPRSRLDRLQGRIKRDFPDYRSNPRLQFHASRFRRTMLDNLAKLPPPKHGGT